MSLVIFDLDETMIHGDCSSLWSQRMASLGWVDESFVRHDAELMEQYAEGKLSMDLYMDYTLQPLIGRSVEEVEREVEAYVEEVIEPLIYSDACACLARHRSANDRVLIVSASGVHLVKPIAARIGVDEVLAIDLEVLDGHYTGRTLGTLTYREGKVLRLLDLLEGDDRQLADAWFYSDSRNDLPLLKLVGHPNTVNPTRPCSPTPRKWAGRSTPGADRLAAKARADRAFHRVAEAALQASDGSTTSTTLPCTWLLANASNAASASPIGKVRSSCARSFPAENNGQTFNPSSAINCALNSASRVRRVEPVNWMRLPSS